MFGGYAEPAWSSAGASVGSMNCFLFCLYGTRNAAVGPFKMTPNGNAAASAITGHASYGPCFGPAGHDFYVNSDGRTCVWNVGSHSYTAGPLSNYPSAPGASTQAEEFDVYELS